MYLCKYIRLCITLIHFQKDDLCHSHAWGNNAWFATRWHSNTSNQFILILGSVAPPSVQNNILDKTSFISFHKLSSLTDFLNLICRNKKQSTFVQSSFLLCLSIFYVFVTSTDGSLTAPSCAFCHFLVSYC